MQSPLLFSSSSDSRKRALVKLERMENVSPRKYFKRDVGAENHLLEITTATETDDDHHHHHQEEEEEQVIEEEVEPREISSVDREYKTEVAGGVYELVPQEEEEPQNVVVMDEVVDQASAAAYAEPQNYFCDSCKETGLAYEQEILRLREELKQKDSIISSLKNLIGPTRIILPGGGGQVNGGIKDMGN